MQTLTYGRKKPDTGDKGSVYFPALEDNIDLDDAHTHDGVTSPTINSSNLTATVSDVTDSSWNASGDYFRKQVTYPGTYSRYNCTLTFWLEGGADAGHMCHPHIEHTGNTVFWLYSPVNDQAFKVVFK